VFLSPCDCFCSNTTLILPQAKVALWNFPDRSSATGKLINQYLAKQMELSDTEVHELFSSNRREKM
jgi:hypothetical protein